MSAITKALLCNIDYTDIIKKRKKNFQFVHEHLHKLNQLDIPMYNDFVPMVYPFFPISNKKLKQKLIHKKIFVATYWPNVIDWCVPGDFEYSLTENILPLPIDQRYNENDLLQIINLITGGIE